jgi:ABC-type glycerol-3-phosphate transport system substrate-binding protein
MCDQGTWDIPLHPKTVPDLSFGVFLWPKKVTQQHIPTSGSSAMTTKASKDPDATWEFIRLAGHGWERGQGPVAGWKPTNATRPAGRYGSIRRRPE